MSSIPNELPTDVDPIPSKSYRGGDAAREIKVLEHMLGFTQVHRLGKDGSYGRVYKAVDPHNRPLIAKCPQNLNDPRWPKEVANHKNLNTVKGVPQYFGEFEFDSCSFLFVEYVDGDTLADLYADKDEDENKWKIKAVAPNVAARVVCEAAKIVHAFHAKGYLHRDLSVSNVMVDKSDAIWVIDFGLSLWAGTPRVTKSDEPGLGNAWFRSPEQSKRRSEGWELDARTDVYSLGRLLLWLLAEKIEGKTPVLPREIDEILIAICNKATAEQRDDRFPDAKTLADALQAWLLKDSDHRGKEAVDRYLEPWRDRLNRCFRSEDEVNGEAKILHIYHKIDDRPIVDYEKRADEEATVEIRPSTPELKQWYQDEVEKKVTLNEPHAVLTGNPDWGVNDSERMDLESRIALYKELTFWRHVEKTDRSRLPRILSANALLFCEEKEMVIVHQRFRGSATYATLWHTFGGGFLPEFGHTSARDDEHDLLLTAIRETLEESQLAPAFARDTPAIMCREMMTNFHQLMLFAKPVSKWELERAKPENPGKKTPPPRWEGFIKTISFHELEDKLITGNWVPTGRLHILAWLAMGAPLLRPEKKFFGGKTPWEVYQSVTSAILLKQQESDTTK